jgi:hypothetical protein
MITQLLEAIFGCFHRRTTFPQGKMGFMTVKCLGCGRELAYDWSLMRIGKPVQAVNLPRPGAVQKSNIGQG